MTDQELLKLLKEKRQEIAVREGLELYMVFSNETLRETTKERPETEEELLEIKGWGKVKTEKYGQEIIALITGEDSYDTDADDDPLLSEVVAASQDEDHVYSVGSYLDILNTGLRKSGGRVKGEVTSFNGRPGDSFLFFTISDSETKGVMNCFMWQDKYEISGVDVEEGMEIIVEGHPSIHTPSGRFSFQTSTIELAGEGALMKAYKKLKKKLTKEGIFSEERKRPLPDFPKNIGVITSLRGGTVIHDFQNNLEKHGFKIKAIDARVEGKKAVNSLLKALDQMEKLDIDVLVIIRGGGSLESLQAFDNETLVRRIVDFPVPVIAGIGHHEDVTLTAIAADVMQSTPQGVAEMLNKPWQEAKSRLKVQTNNLLSEYGFVLSKTDKSLVEFADVLRSSFGSILDRFKSSYGLLRERVHTFSFIIQDKIKKVEKSREELLKNFDNLISLLKERLDSFNKTIEHNNPERHLSLGYSIIKKGDSIVRFVDTVDISDKVDIRVSDGNITSEVINKQKNNKNA